MSKLFYDMPKIQNAFSKDDRIVVYCGDCISAIKEIPKESIQLIITSPPYNISKSYECNSILDRYLKSAKNVLRNIIKVLVE